MEKFARLIDELGVPSSQEDQIQKVHAYLSHCDEESLNWSVHLLRGHPFKRLCSKKELVTLFINHIEFSEHIFEQCIDATGDILEAISLSYPKPGKAISIELAVILKEVELVRSNKEEIDHFIISSWQKLALTQRYYFNKIITSTFRSPVSSSVLCAALAQYLNQPLDATTYNFHYVQDKTPLRVSKLRSEIKDKHNVLPIPIIEPVENNLDLNSTTWENHFISYQWNGVRCQLLTHDNGHEIWSRRLELITDKFPEFNHISLPKNTILDGVIIAISNGKILPKSEVRKRIDRKRITKKDLEKLTMSFLAFDIMRSAGQDVTGLTLEERLVFLQNLFAEMSNTDRLQLAENLLDSEFLTIQEIWESAKTMNSRALIIKAKNDAYNTATHWIKYSAKAQTTCGVLLYARRGEGYRSNEFVELTLGARQGSNLIPFTKVIPNLEEEERLAIRAFIRENLIERFGPVYSVRASIIIKISFDGVEPSRRHKCGLKLKNPLFLSWEKDKSQEDVISLEELMNEIG